MKHQLKKYQTAGNVTPSLYSQAMEQLQFLKENPKTWENDPDMQGPDGKLNLCLDCINVDWSNPDHIRDAYKLIEEGYSTGTHYNEEAFHKGLESLGLKPPVYNSKPAVQAAEVVAPVKALGGPISDFDIYHVPQFMMGGNQPCYECGGKYAAGGITNCPEGTVPDATGKCVDNLATPPTSNSSFFDYYQQNLAKYGSEIAGKMISSKRRCSPGDECWDEPAPKSTVEPEKSETAGSNYYIEHSPEYGNSGVGYLYKNDPKAGKKVMGTVLVRDWLQGQELENFMRTGSIHNVQYDANKRVWNNGYEPHKILEDELLSKSRQGAEERRRQAMEDIERQKQLMQQKASTRRPTMEEGGIHIDPYKRGTFKAQATRMNMSTQEAASHILANKENYSPEMVKKAVFAHNFAKEFGGYIEDHNPFGIDKFDEGGPYDSQYKAGDFRTDVTTSHTLNDLESNNWNRGLATANSLGNPNSMMWALPNRGFGSGLKAVAGAAAGLSGAVLGYEKLFNGNKTTKSNLYNSDTGEFGKTQDVLKARYDAGNPPLKPQPGSGLPYNLSPEFFNQIKSANSNIAGTTANPTAAVTPPATTPPTTTATTTTATPAVISNQQSTPNQTINSGSGTVKQDAEGNYIYGSDATGWSKSQSREIAESKWRAGQYNHTPTQQAAAPVSIPQGLQNFMQNPNLQQKRNGGLAKFWPGGPIVPGFSTNPLQQTFQAQGINAGSVGNTISGGNYMDFNGASPEQVYDGVKRTVAAPVNNPKVQMQQQWSTTEYGDPAGMIAANNALNGLGMMNDVLGAKDYEKQYRKHMRDMGNTDAMYNADNPVNPFGSYTTNVGPGSNYSLVTNGFAQDFGTKGVAAKYGGMKTYRHGGTYNVSQTELMYILANGGEIEYL